MLYIFLICGATILIAVFNIIFQAFSYPWWYLLSASVISTIAVIAVDGMVATIIRHLPEKWFSHKNERFNVPKGEIKFYEKIGIKKWKDLIPELGGFTNFHKNHVSEPNNPEYIERFLLEINYGYVLHVLGVPFGFLIMLLDYHIYTESCITVGLTVALPVAIVNAILCLLPAFVLRYNYPRLQVMHKFALRKSKKKES